jgi:penicillin G amidase
LRKRTRILLGILIVLLAVAVAVFFFFRYQLEKSFPQETGSLTISGLVQPVHVVRDAYGVPRIEAQNEHDAMVALGFVHAQDRLWQMDMQRRAADGRLSEIIGAATLPFDKMFRIVGLRRISEEIERSLTSESRFRLQWYSEGVNAFIIQNKGKYPLEFDLLRYDPEPWEPRHSLVVARLIGWELNLSWWTDCVYASLEDRLGYERASEIFPPYPASVPPAVPSSEWRKYLTAAEGYYQTVRDYFAFLGSSIPAGGSNAWVVAPSRSASGSALLANDTHLHLTQPPQWYEAQIATPGWSVSGMSIPGIPGIVTGRNDSIAWGFTNLMADEADFYIERLSPDSATQYFYNEQWLPLKTIEEEIPVRGEDPVTLRIRLTQHGPIVSDVATSLTRSHWPYVASMRWTGAEVDNPIDAFHAINRATNWNDFTRALKGFCVPGQNVVYADVRGNIGYYAAVRLPIRKGKQSLVPLPGWEPASEWQGFVPFELLPHVYNPAEGYFATANNKTVDDEYPYHISDLWEPDARIKRLRAMLSVPGQKYTVRDCEQFQVDSYSAYAKELLPYILDVLADSAFTEKMNPHIPEYFHNWDYRFTRDDITPSLYHGVLVRLIHNTFADEMGDDLFHDFVMLVNVPLRVLQRLMPDAHSHWFDDTTTVAIETRDDILRKSIREAIAGLEDKFGPDTREWRWAKQHTVTLQHPFGLQRPLDKIFSVGPYPFDGGSTALISGEYDLNQPFTVTVGPSYRMIFDLGNAAEYRAVLPTGQSGQVFHPHYDDQLQLWVNGAYRTVQRGARESGHAVLVLEPVR